MATTVSQTGKFINVVFSATHGDFDLNTFFAASPEVIAYGLKVRSIAMIPTAADDVLTVRNAKDADTSSPIVFSVKAASEYSRPSIEFAEGSYIWPAVDATEVTVDVTMVMEVE